VAEGETKIGSKEKWKCSWLTLGPLPACCAALLLLLTSLFAIVGGGAVVTLNITLPYLLLPCCPVKAPRLPSLLNPLLSQSPALSALSCDTTPASPHRQGEAITSSLRKVTDDMKTKNRADRGAAVVVVKERDAASAPGARPGAAGAGRPGAAAPRGPPRLEFDAERKKWMVENQVGVSAGLLTAPSHMVDLLRALCLVLAKLQRERPKGRGSGEAGPAAATASMLLACVVESRSPNWLNPLPGDGSTAPQALLLTWREGR
jgi:hypothetical protein